MSLSREDKYNFFQILFLESVDSILRAQEFSKLKASLSRSERKRIEKNFDEIAKIAAGYFVDKYAQSDSLNITDEQIIEAISLATLAYLENG